MPINGIKSMDPENARWDREVERVLEQYRQDIAYLKNQILILTKKVT